MAVRTFKMQAQWETMCSTLVKPNTSREAKTNDPLIQLPHHDDYSEDCSSLGVKIEPSLNNGGRFLAVDLRRVLPTIPMARAPSIPIGNPFRNVLRVNPFLLLDICSINFESRQ